MVKTVVDGTDSAQNYQCATFDIFIRDNLAIVGYKIWHLDGLTIIAVVFVALVIFQFITVASENWTPLGWFVYVLNPSEKFAFALIIVGLLTALIFEGQLKVMQGQLREMHEQTVTTRAQIRANIGPNEFAMDKYQESGVLAGWEITPKWKNNGPTDAVDFKAWYGVIFKEGRNKKWTVADCPPISEPAGTQTSVIQGTRPVAQLAERIALADVKKAINDEGALIAAGHLQYRDIFPDDPLHYIDWCARLVPNDLAADRFSFLNLRMESH